MLAREPMSQPFASNADLPFAVHCGNSERGTKKAVFPLSELNSRLQQGGKIMVLVVFGVTIGGLCALLRCRMLMMLVISAYLAVGGVLGAVVFHP
jgi:hypothetical protein